MSTPTALTLAAWALLEVGVRVRERVAGRGRRDRDRATRVLIAVTLGGAYRTYASARARLIPRVW